ncbi:MAG: hypothetical protein KC503_42910 [Myxococcales bacterium]|nr:hypothetical protein [Myxococcales bacterium]
MHTESFRTAAFRTAAFRNERAAWGARDIKPQFGRSAEADLWFALGFPHVGFIDESPADGADWQKLCFETGGFEPLVVLEGVAARWLRLQGVARVKDAEGKLTAEARAILEDDAEITRDEACAILRRHFECRDHLYNPAVWFEALFGPDALLEVIVPLLEQLSDEKLAAPLYNDPEGYYAGCMGQLLRRAERSAADAYYQRLRATVMRAPPSAHADATSFAHTLGIAVCGAAFVSDFGYRVDGRVDPLYLLWADDDPDFVRSEVLGSKPGPPHIVYPRLVFIAGDELIERCEIALKRGKDRLMDAASVRTFGLMRSERALQLLLWMTVQSKAKAEAKDWFVANRDHSQTFLERMSATAEPTAKSASALLKKIETVRKREG